MGEKNANFLLIISSLRLTRLRIKRPDWIDLLNLAKTSEFTNSIIIAVITNISNGFYVKTALVIGSVFMIEDFEQDDFDLIDPSAKQVLIALSQFEKGLLVKVDLVHRKTGLMPEGLNDAVRHLSKSKLIDILETPKRMGPYEFYAVEITDLGREVIAKFG